MRLNFPLIILTLIVGSCENTDNKNLESQIAITDTIFHSNLRDHSSYKPKIVAVTDPTESFNPEFIVGDTTYFKANFKGFEQYPSFITGDSTVLIISIDSVNAIFGIIPNQCNFEIELWKDFGYGKVIFAQRTDSLVLTEPRNGRHFIAGIKKCAKKSEAEM